MRKFLFTLFKLIIGAAAVANLAALFLFEYDLPVSWKLPAFPFGSFRETEVTVERTTEAEGPQEENEGDQQEPSAGEETAGSSMRIEVPSSPINYNGSGELDLMTGVYVLNADGTAATGVKVTTDISEGTSRREKTITYSAETPDGTELTATRNLYLGSRYTGPSISILKELPYCLEGEAEAYAQKLTEEEFISAENGFNADITDQVTSTLKSYNAGREEATITLAVTNEFKDTFTTDVSISMNAPKVSFVIPVYNTAKYLDKCMQSVLHQTLTDIEIIVVDDGSTDNVSPGMCDEYAKNDSRVMVIHKPNGGLTSSWIEGSKAASADYLCFVDSDDWVDTVIAKELYALTDASFSDSEIISSNYIVEKAGERRKETQSLAPGVYMEKDLAKLADILGHNSINTTKICIISTGCEHLKRMENMRLVV